MPTITRANARNFARPLSRPQPRGPVQAYKTYAIEAPLNTHWVKVNCIAAGCLNQHNGFRIEVDLNSDLGRKQAYYITQHSGRQFTEHQDERPGIVVFEFPPGTECFAPHYRPAGKPPLFIVRGGDWRQNLGVERRHTSAESWVDDFASHQDRLERTIRR